MYNTERMFSDKVFLSFEFRFKSIGTIYSFIVLFFVHNSFDYVHAE